MKVKFLFAWYDLWVGIFIDKKKRTVYIFPLPMFGLSITIKNVPGNKSPGSECYDNYERLKDNLEKADEYYDNYLLRLMKEDFDSGRGNDEDLKMRINGC